MQAGSGAPGFTRDRSEVTGQNLPVTLGGVAKPLGEAEDTLWRARGRALNEQPSERVGILAAEGVGAV